MAFRASATAGDGATTNVASLSITIPANAQIGDVAVLNCAGTNTTQTLTTPTGWTLQDNTSVGSGQTWLFTKTLVSGDPGASVTLTWSGTVRPTAAMRVYSGVTMTGAVFVKTSVATAGTSFTVPSMTSVPAGASIDVAISGRAAFAVADTASFPSPYTAEGSAATAITTSPNSICAGGFEIAGTAGTYGGETVTLGEATTGVAYGYVLPSSGATSGLNLINFAQADNGGLATATLTVPSGVTTAHFGVVTVAASNSGVAGTAKLPGWTVRDNNSRALGLQTASAWIFTRLGGQAAGDTLTVTMPSSNGATITGVWYDTQGREVSHVSSLWDTNAADDGTVVFNGPGHADTRDVLLVAAIRTSATPPTLGTPTGATIDYQRTSTAGGWNAGGVFGHVNGVSSQPYSAAWSTGTAHNVNALQLAFEPSSGINLHSSTATRAETANGTSLTINVPSGTANGDLLLLALSAGNPSLPSTLTGWTKQADIGTGLTALGTQLWSRVASSEPASYTVTLGTIDRFSAEMIRVTGADATTPFDGVTPVIATNASTAATTTGTVSTNSTDAVILHLLAYNTGTGDYVEPFPLGVSPVINTTGTGERLRLLTEYPEAPGTTTARTFTCSGQTSNTANAAITLALRKSGAGLPNTAYQVAAGVINDAETTNVGSVSFTIPASAKINDVIVVGLVYTSTSATLTAPTGWTQRDPNGSTGTSINATATSWLLTKTLVSGDPGSTATFTPSSSTAHFIGTYAIYRNGTETGFTVAQATDTPGTNLVLPSLTSVPANAIFGFAALRRYAGTPAQAFHITSGAYTVDGYVATNYGASPELSALSGWKTTSSSGTYGAETETVVSGSNGSNYVYNIPSAGTQYTAAPADNEGITDTVTSVVQGNVRAPADTVGLTDAVTVVRTVVKSVADNVGITDVGAPDEESTASAGPDSVGITDAVSTQLTHTASAADTVGLTDSVTIVRTVFQTKADNVGITDTPTTGRTVARTAADNVGITDTPTAHQDINRTAADTVGVTDALAYGGTFAQPVVVTASPDVERQTADLEDVGRLSGTASVQTTASAVDLRRGPQRAKTSIVMSGTLTHVTGLHGTAAPELDTSLSRLNVVHSMTDIVVRQENNIAPSLTLRNGPIYSDGTGVSATGGIETGVLGPTHKPVWRLDRNEAVVLGWGAYIAADVTNNIPVGTTVTLSVWYRGPVGGFTQVFVYNDAATSSPVGGASWNLTTNGAWQQFTETVTLTGDWLAGVHRFRATLPHEVPGSDYIEWSDPTVQLIPDSNTGEPQNPAHIGFATVGTATTAPALMVPLMRPMQMAKETVKKVSRIFRTLR